MAALFALAAVCCAGALLGFALLPGGATHQPLLYPLGRTLAEAFLWAAPLVPALLLAFSVLAIVPGVGPTTTIAFAPAGLVVLTLGALAQLTADPSATQLTAALTHAFGRPQTYVLLVLALALEGLVTVAVIQRVLAPAGSSRPSPLITDGSEIVELPEIADLPPVPELPPEESASEDAGAAPPPEPDPDPAPAPVADDPSAFALLAPAPTAPLAPLAEPEEPTVAGTEPPVAPALHEPARDDPAPPKRRRNSAYHVPVDGLLDDYDTEHHWKIDRDTEEAAEVLMATLAEFKIEADVTGIRRGPVITMFEILPAPGVKISRIVNLADNIALRLAASRVRIVAPIPGKHAVGIEVPNRHRAIVSFKEMVALDDFTTGKAAVPVVLGKDITGEAKIVDLTATPHLLIAGATGSGKSVCVNSIICSVLYSRRPDEVRLMLIDPKIVELKFYNDVPHLLTPVITDPRRAFQALQYCLCEMERRYALLDAQGVRDIRSYNQKVAGDAAGSPIPYLVIVIDEFADLMASTGKELESTLARLAAMSRAVGIHLVLATQRPSIEVITGLIKANIPSRIAFMVAGKFDSRIIIDTVGAEKLLGKGDMLFAPAWDANPERIQGAFLSEREVERVVDHVRTLGEPDYVDEELLFDEDAETAFAYGEGDPLMEQALDVVVGAGKASASYLQRKLKIGYNRAARLVEEMEERGIVGPANGSKPRELIHIPSREPATAAEHP